jgi:hypothetical protein
MHGAPSGPGAGVEPTAEAIDSVLSRFQDWNKARNGRPMAKSGSVSAGGRGTPTRKVNLAAGARELSYEQALRATSYRRQGYQPHSQTTAPLPLAAKSPELDSVATADDSALDASAAKASSTRPQKLPRNIEPPIRRVRVAASPVAETAAVVGAIAAPQSEMPLYVAAPSLATERRKRASGSAPKSPVRTGGRNRTLTEPAQPQNSTSSQGPKILPPAFCEVLQQSASLAAGINDSTPPANKTIALSLRVSGAEQARIQACAERANVSVSAYLRQCALGVEELRGQVELALRELRKQETQPTAPPGLSAIPGILRHVAASWLRGLRGNRDFTGISLR